MLKRVIVGSVVAAGLVVAAPAGAAAPPTAQQSGGDVPPPLPSLVQTRLTRVDNALERLTEDVNDVDTVHAPKAAKTVRRQLAAAWRGAKYYITHPPVVPPEAEDASVHSARGVRVKDLSQKVRAKITQDDEGPVIADPVATASAVFDQFHNVSSTIIELTDGARVPVLDDMSRTMFLALDRRDKAIEDVHTLAPPAPPEDAAAASVGAKAAQDEEAVTFDTVMPGQTLWLDDELQHVDGLLTDATDLRPGGSRILTKARAQIVQTEAKINTYWPPVIDD